MEEIDYKTIKDIPHTYFNESILRSLYRLKVDEWVYVHNVSMDATRAILGVMYVHSTGYVDVTFKDDYSAFKKNFRMMSQKDFGYLLGNSDK